MFIPFWVFVIVIIYFAFFHVSEADQLIAEMRDPGGIKRQASLDARAATKAARKAARAPGVAIVCRLMLLATLIFAAAVLSSGVTLFYSVCGLLIAFSIVDATIRKFALGLLIAGVSAAAHAIAAVIGVALIGGGVLAVACGIYAIPAGCGFYIVIGLFTVLVIFFLAMGVKSAVEIFGR